LEVLLSLLEITQIKALSNNCGKERGCKDVVRALGGEPTLPARTYMGGSLSRVPGWGGGGISFSLHGKLEPLRNLSSQAMK